MALKDLLGPANSVGEKEGTPLTPIADPDGDSSQKDMESRAERPGKDDSQVKLPLLQGLAEVEIFPKRPDPSLLLKGDDLIHVGKCFPQIDEVAWDKDRQVGFGKESLQLLNRRITEHSIPHPVYSSHQDTIDPASGGAKITLQNIAPSSG